MAETKVVNKHDYLNGEYDLHGLHEDDYVYIGRPSKWGNPFSHQTGTLAKFLVETREEAVRKYEEWIRSQPKLMADAKRELKGKVLMCWCKPLACHGDVLARIADEMQEQT